MLDEWCPDSERYLGTSYVRRINYILKGEVAYQLGVQKGYCVMSIGSLSSEEYAEYRMLCDASIALEG